MDVQFVDRTLNCSDCHGEFVFTAGEQLFFHDKQFKNDPKRCKPCKSRRSGLSAVANGTGPVAAGLSRTETRTECSECGVDTTVPFKPTQGRPVLCRQCFQARNKAVAAGVAAAAAAVAAASIVHPDNTVAALSHASIEPDGMRLSVEAAVLAVATMASASPHSSVATVADLAMISQMQAPATTPNDRIPLELLTNSEIPPAELTAAAVSLCEGAEA